MKYEFSQDAREGFADAIRYLAYLQRKVGNYVEHVYDHIADDHGGRTPETLAIWKEMDKMFELFENRFDIDMLPEGFYTVPEEDICSCCGTDTLFCDCRFKMVGNHQFCEKHMTMLMEN